MATDSNDSFDFNAWAELARDNPSAFEKQRTAVTSRLIEQAPAERQQRLKGLQWQVDMAVRRSRSPFEGCLRIHQLMMEKLCGRIGLGAQLNTLADMLDGQLHQPEKSGNDGNSVIDLSSYRQR